MDNLVWIILGMAVVTYLPRLAPFLLLEEKKIPRQLEAFLKCIPPAAIGALIFPGVFTAVPEAPGAVAFGMAVAIVVGLLRGGIILPVVGSVLGTYLWLTFI